MCWKNAFNAAVKWGSCVFPGPYPKIGLCCRPCPGRSGSEDLAAPGTSRGLVCGRSSRPDTLDSEPA